MNLITEHLDTWTTTVQTKSSAGRGGGSKRELYGIKKLRELILELAVRGLLTSSNSSTWTNSTLGELGEWGSGGTPLKAHDEYYGDEIPWLVIGDLNDGLVASSEMHITQLGLDNSSAKIVPKGTLLIAMYGSIGKLGITGFDCATNQAIAFCKPKGGLVGTSYLFVYLRAIRENLLSRGQGLAQQNISQKILKAVPIALPPLAEQQRIVAKVDELMALCDRLEQQQSDHMATHELLVKTLLDALVAAASDAEHWTAAWQRIAAHFDALFTTEASIDQLKQTILQLAVMGKLVPQDPNDEPASELLKKIATEKDKLVKEKKIKKQKKLPEIKENELPFIQPKGWEWCYLKDIAGFENGDRSSRYPTKDDFVDKGIPFFGAPDINEGKLTYNPDLRFISEEKFSELSNGKLIDLDFIMLLRGSVGKVAQFHKNEEHQTGFINAQMLIIRLINTQSCSYLNRYMTSVFFKKSIATEKSGAVIQQIPASKIASLTIPLPPLAEQHRIVAKVDELMALCDALKVKLQAAQATQLNLADSLVEKAVG